MAGSQRSNSSNRWNATSNVQAFRKSLSAALSAKAPYLRNGRAGPPGQPGKHGQGWPPTTNVENFAVNYFDEVHGKVLDFR
jgi:hypothetical protein